MNKFLKIIKLIVDVIINVIYKLPFWIIGIFVEAAYDGFTAGRQFYQSHINR